MTQTITSFTSETSYKLTICEETGQAIDCTCKDMQFRGKYNNHICKHIAEFDKQVQRAAAFILLQREIAEKEANARRAAINALYNPNNVE